MAEFAYIRINIQNIRYSGVKARVEDGCVYIHTGTRYEMSEIVEVRRELKVAEFAYIHRQYTKCTK